MNFKIGDKVKILPSSGYVAELLDSVGTIIDINFPWVEVEEFEYFKCRCTWKTKITHIEYYVPQNKIGGKIL